MQNELKPCPFCGGTVSIATMGDNATMWYFITRGNDENKCTCRVFFESDTFCNTDTHIIKQSRKVELIEKWNKRMGGVKFDNIHCETCHWYNNDTSLCSHPIYNGKRRYNDYCSRWEGKEK